MQALMKKSTHDEHVRELMVGANQYIYKRELQFWSFFPVMLFMHEEKDGSFRYRKVSGKQLVVYK